MNALLRASSFVIAALCATAALAQPKPALVKDVDQPARSMYQEWLTHSCDGLQLCFFDFSPVPPGKRLVVTWVNLTYILASSGYSRAVLKSGAPVVYLDLVPSPDPWTATLRTINSPVMMYVEPGSHPELEIVSDELKRDATATLVGYYVSVP